MDLETVKQLTKEQFQEISDGLFNGSISLQYLEETKRVSAEASPMFGLNIIRYSESNFRYFFILQKYLCNILDILTLKRLDEKCQKLKLQEDLLSLEFIEQISDYIDKSVPNKIIFLENNYILNLFVYLHECGHLNQEKQSQENDVAVNHFSEFNSDYFALTKILQFYYTLKSKREAIYWKKVRHFGNEHNFIRSVITTALLVVYLEVLPKFDSDDTETHPAIKKRFLYLIVQTIQQLKMNFDSLFIIDTVKDFILDIFSTMYFVEKEIFEQHEMVFGYVLKFSSDDLDEIQKNLEHSVQFMKFNV